VGKQSVHFILDRNTKELGVKEDLELGGFVSPSPAIAWEHSGNKGVAMEVDPKVSVSVA
jgi:hypothetical protein